ncbi:hypothetical protein KKF91_14180 [Myxococcota bacterium]|nr:hypothetical protein [Myxococcota bacterium]
MSGANDAKRWVSLPGFEGLYEVDRLGSVRALSSNGGPPKTLTGRDVPGLGRVYDLRQRRRAQGTRMGSSRVRLTVADVVALAFKNKQPAALFSERAAALKLAPGERSEILEKWRRRHLRRYPLVTVEILADTYGITRAQVRAIIAGMT